jgi:DNA-directed RNA polymerase subunit H (RpoH/RPB5)
MLMNRKWINNSEDIKNIVDKILKTENEMTYFYKDKIEYNFKFYLNKISSIKKTDLEEFIIKNKNNHKILITGDISSNTRQQIVDFGKIEVFSKDELMINIVDNILVPKHELLSDNDKKKFMEEYLAKPKELPRIFMNDPIARYYYAKVGDIFRIERPSIVSGFAISYRIVVSV